MDIKFKNFNNSLTIYLYGELDEYSSEMFRKPIDDLIVNNLNEKKIIFDLSGVSFMDSTGIGLLIGRYKKIKQFNIECYITGASFSIEKVLQLSGLYSIMPKY